ncbi:O-antigen biosynthesis glycosyltransferase WbnJ [Phycisphaerales bacterium]|nr:O-antigen biosynthesis glycosyltransferase WbnJ [Phycisphaerales bacterium]
MWVATMSLISVALPVWNAADTLAQAVACLTAQTHADLEVLVVLNGGDEATAASAGEAAKRDARVRVLSLEQASLPAALNVALREAKGELVARMDADDWCPPERIATQGAAMSARPGLAALGSAFELEETSGPSAGQVTATIRPPTDPRESRWRLLLGNPFAHGSMMLRRDAVLRAGGYDERLPRAQDYDLWLRLAEPGEVCALPDVLYRHRRRAAGAYSASGLQASLGADVMVRAWGSLPGDGLEEIGEVLAQAMAGEESPGGARRAIEEWMAARGPSREAILAWLWLGDAAPTLGRAAVEACRGARAREVARAIRAAGGSAVWLYGAGMHSGWLIDEVRSAGLEVRGLIDDSLAGQARHGFMVGAPEAPQPGEHVLLSSDTFEDQLWARSEELRRRGTRVWRLYRDAPDAVRVHAAS